MDSHDLRVFEAVARLGSMNRAATELNTVQSNVTARIQQLEAELGTRLFERHARGVRLTPAGRRLLPFAAEAGRLLASARRAVEDDGTPRGLLRLGTLESTAGVRLAPVLPRFAATFPLVDLVLTTGTTAELTEEVLSGAIEGAFVCGPVDHGELVEETVFQEELAVATPHGLATLDDLHGRRDLKVVVLRAGCSYRDRLDAILARRGLPRLRRMEFASIEGIVDCVVAGLGITLLPRSVVEPARAAGKVAIHPLPPEEAQVDTVFIRRRDGHASSALRAFLDQARQPPAGAAAAE